MKQPLANSRHSLYPLSEPLFTVMLQIVQMQAPDASPVMSSCSAPQYKAITSVGAHSGQHEIMSWFQTITMFSPPTQSSLPFSPLWWLSSLQIPKPTSRKGSYLFHLCNVSLLCKPHGKRHVSGIGWLQPWLPVTVKHISMSVSSPLEIITIIKVFI